MDGEGYELVIRDPGKMHIERFSDFRKLLSREHQLLTAWKAQGWRNAESAYAAVQCSGAES